MNDSSLRYSDERDKTYGIAGMAITIVALDGEKYLSGISLDAEPGEHIAMSYDYGMRGNPRISAKIIWEQAVNDLRLSTSMVLGNIACRRYVLGHRPLGSADTEVIRLAVRSEAGTHCELDNDEADRLFDGCLSYVLRIFRHPGIQEVAHSFCGRLAQRRSMSGAEVTELLSSLGLR